MQITRSPFPEHVQAVPYLCASADLCQVLTVQDSIPVLARMPSRPAAPLLAKRRNWSPSGASTFLCVHLWTLLTSRLCYNCAFYFPCCLGSSMGKCPVLDSSDVRTITCPRRRLNKDFMNEAGCVDGRVMSTRGLK